MKKLPFLFFLFVFLLPSFVFAYGDTTTHPALTEVIVDEYNKRHPESPITAEQKELIIKGSTLEDTPPRWVNHLYDPVRRISWNGENLGSVPQDVTKTLLSWGVASDKEWLSAVDWADNRAAQEKYERYGGDRTWTRALEYWANNDKDQAYLTLGYVLHLLEDMGVPDHTRNDPHPPAEFVGETGSPYENYAKKWTRQTIRQGMGGGATLPISKSNVREYLESMALYSNKYFFSKDTINDSAYEFPKIVREDSNFGYGVDEGGTQFVLVKIGLQKKEGEYRLQKIYSLKNDSLHKSIYDAYFSRLSKQIVGHGVGLVNLFHYEAADYIPQHVTRVNAGRTPFGALWSPGAEILKAGGAVKNFFGNMLGGAVALFTTTFGGDKSEEISLTDDDDVRDGISAEDPISAAPPYCSFQTNQKPKRDSVILSEIAWMGSVRSAREEWMEVQNISGAGLDVSGFQIIDLREDIKIRFPAGARIGADGFYLFERGEGAVPEVNADILYSGSLSNDGEGVRLFDKNCNLLDEVLTGSPWSAGNNGTKQTMERGADLSWHTSVLPGGTPRAANSAQETRNKVQETTNDDEDEAEDENAKSLEEIRLEEDTRNKAQDANKAQDTNGGAVAAPPASGFSQCSYQTSGSPRGGALRLNEIAWMGTTRSASDEWFEIYNTSGAEVDLSGWQILDKGEQIRVTFSSGLKVPAGGHLLFERTDDDSAPGVAADFIYAGGLGNSDEGLRLFDSSCRLIDEALASPLWEAGSNSSKGTMERREDGGWQTSGVQGGTPRAKNTIIIPSPSGSGGGSSSPAPSLVPAAEETPSASGGALSNLLISEFQAGSGADAKYEFVEIWNPNDSAVDLADWDLKKKTSGGNTQNLATNISGMIPARGFFLIGSQEYNGGAAPDARYTQASNTLAGSNNSILLVNASDEIVDEVFYASLAEDVSYERKSVSGDAYGGHGVDVAGDISDFELRSAPQPQNTGNLPEPRDAPAAPAGVGGADIAAYDAETLAISFSWEEAASATTYEVRNLSSSSALLYSGTSTSYSYPVWETGTSTLFSVRAFDAEGYGSATTTALVEVPSFFNSFSFYADPRSGGGRYLLEAHYDSYPFMADYYNKGMPWSAAVFYVNRDPNISNVYLDNPAPSWQPDDMDSALSVRYRHCLGDDASRSSFILPRSSSGCSAFGGGLFPTAFEWTRLEDNHFVIETASTTAQISFSPSDYVTVAFYSFYDSGGTQQTFKLVAVDKTKYYFSSAPAGQAAPTTPVGLAASFNEDTSLVRLSWASSTDADTLDNLVTYEVAYTTSTDFSSSTWTSTNIFLYTSLNLNFGETYRIAVRAKDDFGNFSTSTEILYAVPVPDPPLTVSNIRWGYITSSSTREISFQFDDYGTLVPSYWTVIGFYVNTIVPDKGITARSFNGMFEDGLTRLYAGYLGCQTDQATNTPSLRSASAPQCLAGVKNAYYPSGDGFPPAGEVRFNITIGSYTASDYITLLFVRYDGNDYNYKQIGRYPVPVYFTE